MQTAHLSLGDDAIVTSYKDVEKLLFQISHRMAAQYHIPFEEVIPQARLIFMRAYRSFDPGKARFTTFIYRKLFWGLTDYLTEEYRSRNHDELNEEMVGMEDHPRCGADDISVQVSEEARVVIQLVIHTPEHLSALLQWNQADGKKKILGTIREYLREERGWSNQIISQSFNELRQVLK